MKQLPLFIALCILCALVPPACAADGGFLGPGSSGVSIVAAAASSDTLYANPAAMSVEQLARANLLKGKAISMAEFVQQVYPRSWDLLSVAQKAALAAKMMDWSRADAFYIFRLGSSQDDTNPSTSVASLVFDSSLMTDLQRSQAESLRGENITMGQFISTVYPSSWATLSNVYRTAYNQKMMDWS
ncbi:MAG: hypothetical protein LUQ25_09020, partial [Methanoregulaceae archaeon]|nr:hypothetical protein [Methanoregulaceae archaeon]